MHAPFRPAPFPALALLGAALCGALSPAVARAADGDATVVVAPRGTAEGDADAAMGDLVGVVERDPGSAEAEAALNAAWALWADVLDPAPFTARLEAVVAKGIPHGEVDELARRTLAERYRERGQEDRRAKAGFDAGYLQRFLVTGPFGVQAQAEIRRPFAPELDAIDLDREMAALNRPVRWHAYPVLGVGEVIEPFQVLRPTTGVAYGLCQVRAAEDRTVLLKVTCWSPVSVRVNGREVLVGDRLLHRLPRTLWAPALLRAGWNRILVKVAGSQGFAVKVCDPATGLPVPGLEEEAARTLHPATEPGPAPAAASFRAHVDALGAREPATPAARIVRAMLRDRAGLDWLAYDDFTAALAAAPRDAGVLHRAASFIESFNQLPDPRWRKNRARALYEDLLEASPNHVEAAMNLARMLNAEDRTEEALAGIRPLPEPEGGDAVAAGPGAEAAAATRAAMERSRNLFPGIDRLLEARPTLARAWLLRADFCDDRKWRKESDEAAEQAVKVHPRNVRALRWRLRAAERDGDTARAEKACREILAVDAGSFGTRRTLAEILHRRGRTDEALAIYAGLARDNPSDFDARQRHATLLADLRRYDEAAALLEELERLTPLDDSFPRIRGGWLRLKGDEEGARKAWERCLALSPDAVAVRRSLERIGGVDEDFARPFEEDAVALWRACGDKTAHPKAVAVHLLDLQVVRVNEDGSWSAITHNAWKILNEQGREKYSNIQVPGELLEVRAVSPEGEVHLPIGALGRGSFTMEGLQEGWLLEYRYRMDSGPDQRGYDGGKWYFQDFNFGGVGPDPVTLSRLVVDVPSALPVRYLLRNYDDAPVIAKDGGRTVYRFEKRDMDRVEQEPRMPVADEICPWVHFHVSETFDEILAQAREYMATLRPTPLLERKAAEVVRGIDGDLARARALYAFVNEYVSGTSGAAGGPTGVLLEASGDRFGLFGALCVAAGIPVDVVRVCTDPDQPALWETLDGQTFGFGGIRVRGGDAGDAWVFGFSRHTPFGYLPERVRGKPALVAGPGGAVLTTAPWGEESELYSRERLRLTLGDGPADTTFSMRVDDPTAGAYGFKEALRDMNADDRRKWAEQRVTELLPTPGLKDYAFPGMEEFGRPLVMEATGTAGLALREEGGSMVLSLGPPPMEMADSYVGKSDREWPFVIRGTDLRDHEVVFDLAGKWRVKRLPRGHFAAGRIGTYSLTVQAKDGEVRVRREVKFGPARYSADEYREFIAWCREIDAAEEQRLVVERVP